ncbi:DUF1707 domain-containing protein [Nocardioides salsibiostraticola]
MSGEVERPDPSLRISDADRERVAEVLREAAGEGRIDFIELDERLEATYAAKVYGDLLPIVVDLPGNGVESPTSSRPPARVAGQVPSVPQGTSTNDRSVAILGSQNRRGVWHIGPQHVAFALLGDIDLDLREATFGAAEVEITANAVLGDIEIIVDAHTRVIIDGMAVLGDFGHGRDRVAADLAEDAPTVRVKGVAFLAEVKVVRRPPPGSDEDRWYRRLPKR